MLYLSLRIGIVIIKRRRSCVHNNATAQQQSNPQSATMLRLLFTVVILYVLNQGGYCLSYIAIISNQQTSVSYESAHEEVLSYVNSAVNTWVVNFIAEVLEVLTRSLNFYLYYFLSSSVKEEFMKAIRIY